MASHDSSTTYFFFFFNSPSNLVDSAIPLKLSSDTVTSRDTYIGYHLHTYPRQALRLTTKQENLSLQCCWNKYCLSLLWPPLQAHNKTKDPPWLFLFYSTQAKAQSHTIIKLLLMLIKTQSIRSFRVWQHYAVSPVLQQYVLCGLERTT